MFFLRFLLLFAIWCGFSGTFDSFHLSLGIMASVWVAGVSSHVSLSYPLKKRSISPIRLTFGLFGYLMWLMVEVFKANLEVIKWSFKPNLRKVLTPTVVEFQTRLADDFPRYLLAQSITLTPGTVTVRVDGDRFLVHALTEEMAAGVPGDMEERLVRLYGGEVASDGS